MGNRVLSKFESEAVRKHIGVQNALYRTNRGANVFSAEQVQQAVAIVQQTQIKADSEYFTSAEFRQDVIDELMANGATLEQATNRTRDQVRLFNEATQLGLM